MKHEGIAKDSPRITSHKQRVIDLQEQIPPAKFDWTSSGLTNPLEGPGKLSCLFFFMIIVITHLMPRRVLCICAFTITHKIHTL